MKKDKVVICYGKPQAGASADEKDTLDQANSVREALGRLGFQALDLPVTLNLSEAARRLKELAPRFVFNLAETLEGRGRLIGLVPALLDSLHIPFSGNTTEAVFLTSNKVLAKAVLSRAGIATPGWCEASRLLRGEIPPFEPPFIVKDVWEHASIGMDDDAICASVETLLRSVKRRVDGSGAADVYVEPFVDGREFNLALLGGVEGTDEPQSLPPAEIRFVDYGNDRPRFVGYRAKWVEGSFEYDHTPRCFDFEPADKPLLERVIGISRECWRVFGLRGYARVDFRVDREGNPMVLEVNTNPCISPDSGFMAAAAQAGLDMDAVVWRIVRDTMRTEG